MAEFRIDDSGPHGTVVVTGEHRAVLMPGEEIVLHFDKGQVLVCRLDFERAEES